jgi:hypothetical protein
MDVLDASECPAEIRPSDAATGGRRIARRSQRRRWDAWSPSRRARSGWRRGEPHTELLRDAGGRPTRPASPRGPVATPAVLDHDGAHRLPLRHRGRSPARRVLAARGLGAGGLGPAPSASRGRRTRPGGRRLGCCLRLRPRPTGRRAAYPAGGAAAGPRHPPPADRDRGRARLALPRGRRRRRLDRPLALRACRHGGGGPRHRHRPRPPRRLASREPRGSAPRPSSRAPARADLRPGPRPLGAAPSARPGRRRAPPDGGAAPGRGPGARGARPLPRPREPLPPLRGPLGGLHPRSRGGFRGKLRVGAEPPGG